MEDVDDGCCAFLSYTLVASENKIIVITDIQLTANHQLPKKKKKEKKSSEDSNSKEDCNYSVGCICTLFTHVWNTTTYK